MAYNKKWKYQKEYKKIWHDEFLYLTKDKKTKIKIKNWDYTVRTIDGEGKNVFLTDVTEVDGKKVDKTFLISNYENLQFLKKKIKKNKKEYTLKLTRKYNDDLMETYFDIEVL